MPPRRQPTLRATPAPPPDKAASRAQIEKAILKHKEKALAESARAAAAAAANDRTLADLEAQAADEAADEPAHNQDAQATQLAELKRRSKAQDEALLEMRNMLRKMAGGQGDSAVPLNLVSPPPRRAANKRARSTSARTLENPTSAQTPEDIDDEFLAPTSG